MSFSAEHTPLTGDSVGPPLHESGASTGELVISPPPSPPSPWLLALAPLAIATVSLVMLWLGGAPAGFGAWLLAAGFPITLGAMTRDKRFAILPVVVWMGWWLAGALVPETTELTRTPWPLALTLAAVGVGATLVAQRAVAPALERAAWLPPQQRLAPSIDGALDPSDDATFDADGTEVSDIVAEPLDEAEADELETAVGAEPTEEAGAVAAAPEDEEAAEDDEDDDTPGPADGEEQQAAADDPSGEFEDIVTTEDLETARDAE